MRCILSLNCWMLYHDHSNMCGSSTEEVVARSFRWGWEHFTGLSAFHSEPELCFLRDEHRHSSLAKKLGGVIILGFIFHCLLYPHATFHQRDHAVVSLMNVVFGKCEVTASVPLKQTVLTNPSAYRQHFSFKVINHLIQSLSKGCENFTK